MRKCFCCDHGEYLERIGPYEVDLPGGEKVVIPDVQVLFCNKCGDEILTPESSRHIEDFIENHNRLKAAKEKK